MAAVDILHGWTFRPFATARWTGARQRWFGFAVLLVAGHILVSTLLLPVSIRATVEHLPSSASETDRGAVAAMLEQEHFAHSVFLPLRLVGGWATFALWLWLLCRAFAREVIPRYRGMLALVVYAELCELLARIAIFIRSSLWSTGDAARDLLPLLGLADLLLPTGNRILSLALGPVNVFSAMFVAWIALGLHRTCRFHPARSIGVALIAWAGSAAWNLLLLFLSGLPAH